MKEHPISIVIPFLANDLLIRLQESYFDFQRSQLEPGNEMADVLTLIEEEIQRRGLNRDLYPT